MTNLVHVVDITGEDIIINLANVVSVRMRWVKQIGDGSEVGEGSILTMIDGSKIELPQSSMCFIDDLKKGVHLVYQF